MLSGKQCSFHIITCMINANTFHSALAALDGDNEEPKDTAATESAAEMANSTEDKNVMDSDPPEFHHRKGSADPRDKEMLDPPSTASTDSLLDVVFGANLHDDVNVEKQQQQPQQPQHGRQGKRPHLEALPSTNVDPFAHAEDVASIYERLCNEVLTGRPCHPDGRSEEVKWSQMALSTPFAPENFEPQLLEGLTCLRHDSSSRSPVNDQSRSPSPPRRRENRAVLEPKTNSDVGSDEEVTADVSAVQALLKRWLDSSASALLLNDDNPVT